MNFFLPNTHHSELFAQYIAQCMTAPMLITLSGEIGAGKTTIIRALLRALGVIGPIKSPTFSLVETYVLPKNNSQFHHFDLYRIVDESELEFLGFREFFQSSAICCIEWPERINIKPEVVDFHLALTYANDGRQISMTGQGTKQAEMYQCVQDFAQIVS
ncbi:MAG TPA: tRNA (adenosine(37)-N6)-threonylcarbamoyltransferase complex ATPase subunit type 1 TsaE [Legionellaceae bacterium]|nr:tRNA (adenosine(37)-N6)-threonylcarbamoyltransferase complex ATPase subunit type 1 TsaE [Legionellaceae bacterium]